MRTTSPNKDSLLLSCSRLKSWCRPLVGGCHHTGGKRPTKHWLQLQKIPLTENKSSSSSSPPTPSGLHLPDISTSHQMLFARSRRGPPSWENLKIPTPPPILSSLNSDATHLVLPVHKDWSLECWNVDFLHYLAIQRLPVASSHLHGVFNILPPLVVMKCMQPEDRIFLVFGNFLFKMFFTSWEAISSRFTKIGCHLLSTFLTIEGVGDPLSPAGAHLFSLTWETFSSATIFLRPWIRSS